MDLGFGVYWLNFVEVYGEVCGEVFGISNFGGWLL